MTKEYERCEGVPKYFRPHQITNADAFVRDGLAYCMPCLFLRLALNGNLDSAQKLLNGDIPKVPVSIDDFTAPYSSKQQPL